MTFGGFLLFLLVPLLLLLWIERKRLSKGFLLTVVGVALGSIPYTWPWDNWLVERQVWWFDWDRCWGIAVGSLPLEELLFYFLIITTGGLWTHYLYHEIKPAFGKTLVNPRIRSTMALSLTLFWVTDIFYLTFWAEEWPRFIFFAQCLFITLPALIIQFAVCGDLIWHRHRFILPAAISFGIYLTLIAGTLTFGTEMWVVNPEMSLIRIPHFLPIEMILFYCLAGGLVVLPASCLLGVDKEYFSTWTARLESLRLMIKRSQA